MYFGAKPYGLEGYIQHHGDGSNMYRGESFAQPRTLSHGDILSNGWQVDGDLFAGYNGRIGINFRNGFRRLVAARLPLQLLGEVKGVLPLDLHTGQILQTGCVVLQEPYSVGASEHHKNQDEVAIKITGGRDGHTVFIPSDLELAVTQEEYPPSIENPLGAFALERTLAMDESARRNLGPVINF